MAKIVIAGKADCPYYSKVELLADQLANTLNSFNVHKIVKNPQEWESWLNEECNKRKFKHTKSPMVWRELVDRGGKGTLIGGANEFQEYAWGYYGIKSPLYTNDVTKIAGENLETKQEIDKEIAEFKSLSNPMKICITNAASPVCYHLMKHIAEGEIFGETQELTINLLGENNELEMLGGLQMEVVDLAANPTRGVNVSCNATEALKDCEAVIMLDQLTRQEEETEESWLRRNADLFIARIRVIDQVCKPTVKILIAGNGPINTSLFMILKEMKNIDKKNIITMPRLLENQAKALLAQKVKVKTSDIVDVIVWGDNEKYFCDINQARVHNHDGPIWGPPSYSRLANILIHEEQWLAKDFLETLQARHTTETEKMKHIPSVAHAAAINTLMRQWWFGSPDDQMITLGVPSEGWYDIPDGMVFNVPARLLPAGQYVVALDLDIPEECKAKIKESVDYLTEQRYVLFPEERPPPPTPEPEKSGGEPVDSPHPPSMTPIKEETDQELRPTEESSDDATKSDSDPHRHTSAEPGMEKIEEDAEPKEAGEGAAQADDVGEEPAAETTGGESVTADPATQEEEPAAAD